MTSWNASIESDLEPCLVHEWLLADGAGGFSMGTAVGAPTRRYHALLIAATTPPTGRVVALHDTIDELIWAGGPEPGPGEGEGLVSLSPRCYGDDAALHPSATPHPCRIERHIEVDPSARFVRWTSTGPGWSVVRELSLTGAGRAVLRFTVTSSRAVALRVRPLTPLRDFHELDHADHADGNAPRIADSRGAGELRIERAPLGSLLTLDLCARVNGAGAGWTTDPLWWRDLAYRVDRDRGQTWREDVWSPGFVEVQCQAGGTVVLEVDAAMSGAEVDQPGAAPSVPAGQTRLDAACEQFIVRRGAAGRSVIAGYPWFADWGRDTMIALPGLLLARNRLADARDVLCTFARHLQGGLLPNCFDDHGGGARYNAVDAPLWFVHAVHDWWRRADRTNDAELIDGCRHIIAAYRAGTDHGVIVDVDDGLVIAGGGGEPVTWMDAQRGGEVFTPRDGKAVEISALWHHALHALADLVGAGAEADGLRDSAAHTASGFERFWWPERDCLHDHLRSGTWVGDGQLRPNQIFAVSLAPSPLSVQRQASVVRAVREQLLTPFGLRTLEPGDPDYRPRFEGDLMSLDGAYHNGTVWPWLIGPFADAVRATGGSDEEIRGLIQPLLDELDRGCVGQIAEVYDGAEPHREGGCPAQAWSVAEVRRVLAACGVPSMV